MIRRGMRAVCQQILSQVAVGMNSMKEMITGRRGQFSRWLLCVKFCRLKFEAVVGRNLSGTHHIDLMNGYAHGLQERTAQVKDQ